mmetsp:Transcript_7766/g.22220  ORF Transcript_7766/g.22220 Transcript_7766/m.22220 type:complete len:228 (-) Transcript_7766:209-892(-)
MYSAGCDAGNSRSARPSGIGCPPARSGWSRTCCASTASPASPRGRPSRSSGCSASPQRTRRHLARRCGRTLSSASVSSIHGLALNVLCSRRWRANFPTSVSPACSVSSESSTPTGTASCRPRMSTRPCAALALTSLRTWTMCCAALTQTAMDASTTRSSSPRPPTFGCLPPEGRRRPGAPRRATPASRPSMLWIGMATAGSPRRTLGRLYSARSLSGCFVDRTSTAC